MSTVEDLINNVINRFKVGDIITAYHSGIHRIIDIQKRYRENGNEYSPLIKYECLLTFAGTPPKGKKPKIQQSDALHCQFAKHYIENEISKNLLLFENYNKIMGIEINNGWYTGTPPDDNEHVLIFCEHIHPNVQHAYWNGEEWKQNEFDFDLKDTYPVTIHNVVGWQPLPKAPIINE